MYRTRANKGRGLYSKNIFLAIIAAINQERLLFENNFSQIGDWHRSALTLVAKWQLIYCWGSINWNANFNQNIILNLHVLKDKVRHVHLHVLYRLSSFDFIRAQVFLVFFLCFLISSCSHWGWGSIRDGVAFFHL